ncbi:DMT family transporter [Martelella endophytica]|uniref:Membrane protein n=1 Tax=Martelella endophytica TaxID=1486262 RepID=A0A0D5LQK9_MAREN|nr:DMT family transporter [Martelella endophytica]AJY46396.1 membrane protein [Martelella endophytica]
MPFDPNADPVRGIVLKLLSIIAFLGMQTCIKLAGDGLAPGQVTFFRSLFAVIPILAYLAWRHELAGAYRTERPFGHFLRSIIGITSMGMGFYGVMHLPLPEVIALGYATPLLSVAFAALLLGEVVRAYRWTAVGVGLFGVMIISWPKLTLFRQGGLGSEEALAVALVLVGAIIGALAMIQVRRLLVTERGPTIVLYFSVYAALLSLLTIPFGWGSMSWTAILMLIGSGLFGGAGQIMMTESYRFADASTIAPFDYTSIIFGIIISYFVFAEIPTGSTLFGSVFVVGAGIFIIFREHRLGLERRRLRRVSNSSGN